MIHELVCLIHYRYCLQLSDMIWYYLHCLVIDLLAIVVNRISFSRSHLNNEFRFGWYDYSLLTYRSKGSFIVYCFYCEYIASIYLTNGPRDLSDSVNKVTFTCLVSKVCQPYNDFIYDTFIASKYSILSSYAMAGFRKDGCCEKDHFRI